MSKQLAVYWQQRLVGILTQAATGQLSFQYDVDYLQQYVQPISIALPLQTEAFSHAATTAFFSNLLPDELLRTRLAKCLGVSAKNAFALLAEVGLECAGALVIVPPDTPLPMAAAQAEDEYQLISDSELNDIFTKLPQRPLYIGVSDVRLSLAGAQDKLAVKIIDGNIALPRYGAPTSHILKPLIDGVDDSIYNEYFCMQLAARCGLEVPETSVVQTDLQAYYQIKRYDRVLTEAGVVERLHQEDFCQALSIVPELKYQREGGPAIAGCLALIKNHTLFPGQDRQKLLSQIIFNFLIGNLDAHGKNFSLLYQGKKPALSPAYDLLSTAIYPALSQKMAMKIGSQYQPERVRLRHWYQLVGANKTDQKMLTMLLHKMTSVCAEQAIALREKMIQQQLANPVYEKIIEHIEQRSAQIRKEI